MPKEFAFHSSQKVGDNWASLPEDQRMWQIYGLFGEKGQLPTSPNWGMFASVAALKSMLSESEMELHYDEGHCAMLALFAWLKADPSLANSPAAPNIKGIEVDFSGSAPQPVRLK